MRSSIIPLAAVLFLFASVAGASTLIDLVGVAEVIEIGEYSEDGVLDVLVRFHRVDLERSATDYFADSFMEHQGDSEIWIALEGLSCEDIAAMEEGSTLNIHYHHVSCILISDDGEGEGYSSSSWTYMDREV